MIVHPGAAVELDAAHAHFLGVGEIAAKHADAGVHDLRLEVLDLGVVDGEVRRDAVERLRLQSDLDVAHVLGLDGRGREDGPAQRVGWHAAKVETDRLEAGRIGRIAC